MTALPTQEEPFDFEGYAAYLEAEVIRLRQARGEQERKIVLLETEVEQLERTTALMTTMLLGQAANEAAQNELGPDIPLFEMDQVH